MANYDQAEKKNLYRVVFIGLCFMLLFTAFQSAQNLVSQIYKELKYDGLGQICLFSIYGALGIGNMFASHFKRKLSHKAGMLLGSFFYTLFIACGAIASYCHKYEIEALYCERSSIYAMNIVSAILLGSSGSVLWLSQSDYVNQCTNEKTKGLFNGVFWSLMQLCQIIGSLIATFVLGNTDQFIFYMLLLTFGCVSIVMFIFLPSVGNDDQSSASGKPTEPISESLKKFFKTFLDGESYFISIITFLSGMIIASYAAFLPALIEITVVSDDHAYINKRTGFVLIALAIGEVLAGIIVGRLADMYNKTKLLNITIMIAETALAMTMAAYLSESYVVVIFSWFVWGFTDNTINTLASSTIGAYFNGKLEMFAIYRFMQGLGVVFGAVLTILIPTSKLYLFFIISGITMLVLHFFFLATKVDKEPKEEETESLLSN